MLFRIGNRRVLRYTRPMLTADPARVVSEVARLVTGIKVARRPARVCGHGTHGGRGEREIMSEFVLGVLCTLWLIATAIILVVVWQLPEVPDAD